MLSNLMDKHKQLKEQYTEATAAKQHAFNKETSNLKRKHELERELIC